MNSVFVAVVLIINCYLISGQICPQVCPITDEEELSTLRGLFVVSPGL